MFFPHLFWIFHSIWLVSLATEDGLGLLDAAARVFQPNRASCTVPRVIVQPPGESPPWDFTAVEVRTPALRTWSEAGGAAASESGGVSVDDVRTVCALWVDAVPVSSSMGVSCEPPRTEEEFESGGTDPETQLGAGLDSPEAVGGV